MLMRGGAFYEESQGLCGRLNCALDPPPWTGHNATDTAAAAAAAEEVIIIPFLCAVFPLVY